MWRNCVVSFSDLSGRVAELVYAYVSEAYGVILGGSSPLTPTQFRMAYVTEAYLARGGSSCLPMSTLV
ncbi:MAG: hypothetical protein JWO50_281 [Candidatus Kaiserbacteria bacterium]|nr:hypothetical protein [Candidatus Kaiserbacteria bacterium]